MSAETGVKERDFEADRARYARNDPYADREIELKLGVEHADVFELLDDVEHVLRDGKLQPYMFDDFWETEKSYVGSRKFTLLTHEFGFEDGREAFKVREAFGACWIREKATNAPDVSSEDAIARTVLDRREQDSVITGMPADVFLKFLQDRTVRDRRPIVYFGSYSKDLRCIACHNPALGHRYALMADLSVAALRETPLAQLEIEYIWRREASERSFSKQEICEDIANLARRLIEHCNRQCQVLRPSSLTKFAWLKGRREVT